MESSKNRGSSGVDKSMYYRKYLEDFGEKSRTNGFFLEQMLYSASSC